MHRECREWFTRHRLQRKSLARVPSMHHGTCMTHVPWCMSGSLTRCDWENVRGIPAARMLYAICVFLRQSIKIKPSHVCIARDRAQFKINIHWCWNLTCLFHTGSQLSNTASAPSFELFYIVLSDVKQTHWTNGSCRCCLSLVVVRSIPAWSKMISRFLCGLYVFHCARAPKQQICNAMWCMYV